MAKESDGALVTGRLSHEVFVIRDGKRHWIPDSWTMSTEELSPADLQVIDDDVLKAVPLGDDVPSSVPPPTLPPGTIIETENGCFRSEFDGLHRLFDPRELVQDEAFDVASVTYLPASLV